MGEEYHQQQGESHSLKTQEYLLTQGQVEGEVQGEDEILEIFWKDVDQGPRRSRVDKVDKSEIDTLEEETVFEVRR